MAPATKLELRMEKATFLKNVLEVLSGGLFSKASFEFFSTGLELQAMDTSSMALVVLQLGSEAFDQYISNNDFSVGLNLTDMAGAFSSANNDDIVTIKYEIDHCPTFVISLGSPDGSVIEYFNLNFVGVNDVPRYIAEYQEFEYQAIIRMSSAMFMDFCNVLSCYTEGMEMETVEKDQVCFFADGELGSSRIVCQPIQTVDKSKDATDIELKTKENISLTFGLRNLRSLCKASILPDQVTIKLSSKLPAVFEYNITERSYIRYYVTPFDLPPPSIA